MINARAVVTATVGINLTMFVDNANGCTDKRTLGINISEPFMLGYPIDLVAGTQLRLQFTAASLLATTISISESVCLSITKLQGCKGPTGPTGPAGLSEVPGPICLVNTNSKLSDLNKWCFKIDSNGDLLICCVCEGYSRVIQRFECGTGTIYISMIVDVSGSIESADAEEEVRDAVISVVNTLNGTSSQLAILRFSGPSSSYRTGSINDAKFITDTSGDFYRDMSNPTEVSTTLSEINSGLDDDVFGGFTNWEAAFKKTQDQLTIDPNVIIFITDGNPTVSIGETPNTNGNNEDYFADRAAIIADQFKANGTRIISVLIGNNIDEDNVNQPIVSNGNGIPFVPSGKFITSDSTNNGSPVENIDYFIADFEDLGEVLEDIVTTMC